jgi:hypothetical protein
MASRYPTDASIPRTDREALRADFGSVVDRASITFGAAPIDSVTVGGQDLTFDESTTAQTFGEHIYVRSPLASLSDDERLRLEIHELTHVQQYERFGSSLYAMGFNYFQDYAQAGFSYRNNELERQAYGNEDDLLPGVRVAYDNIISPPTFCLVGIDGALRLTNSSTGTINFSFRWNNTAAWAPFSIPSGQSRVFYIYNDCGQTLRTPQVEFDDSFDTGLQLKTYNLNYLNNPQPNDPNAANAFPGVPEYTFDNVRRTPGGNVDLDLYESADVSKASLAPVQVPLADMTVRAGSVLELADIAADPDLVEKPDKAVDPLIYSLTAAPPGTTIDPATGAIHVSPDASVQPGDYRLTVTVSKRDEPTLRSTDTVKVHIDAAPIPPTVVAERTVWQPVGHPRKGARQRTQFAGFELAFNEALNPTRAQNAGNYTVVMNSRKGRHVVTKPVAFRVVYNAGSSVVDLLLAGKQTFPQGGTLSLIASPGGLTSTSGTPLVGPNTFTILRKARGITT